MGIEERTKGQSTKSKKTITNTQKTNPNRKNKKTSIIIQQ